jgi:alkylhydroperoxidase family enzyme
VRFHTSALRAEGGDELEVQEILGVPGLRGQRLTRKEALTLDFCRQVALDAHAVTDEQVEELRGEGVTDAEIIEMLEVACFTASHTKIVDALKIESDPWLDG